MISALREFHCIKYNIKTEVIDQWVDVTRDDINSRYDTLVEGSMDS